MKPLTTLVLLASTLATAALTTGCVFGCESANSTYRAPLTFAPSSTLAFRTPATCGTTDQAFTASDTLSLELTGETNVAPPYTTLTLEMAPLAVVGQAVPLTVSQPAFVGPSAGTTTAVSSDGTMHFTFVTGSDSGEIDANPLASVVVTVNALPEANGQPLGAELQLTFQDGRVLDQTYAAQVATVIIPCYAQLVPPTGPQS